MDDPRIADKMEFGAEGKNIILLLAIVGEYIGIIFGFDVASLREGSSLFVLRCLRARYKRTKGTEEKAPK